MKKIIKKNKFKPQTIEAYCYCSSNTCPSCGDASGQAYWQSRSSYVDKEIYKDSAY